MKSRSPSFDKSSSALWHHWLQFQTRRPRQVVTIDALRDLSWSAETLTCQALAFSTQLASHPPGRRIAFRLPNSPEWLALFLALQHANLAAVPLDAALPDAGCFETARRIGVHALYLNGRFHPLETREKSPDICCLKITSGSSGEPKTVACRPEHLLADGRQVTQTMGIRPRDRNLAVIPLGHSYGLGNLVLPLILQGTALVTASEYVPRQIIEWIDRYEISVLPIVPALIRALAGLPIEAELATLRLTISAGAVLSPVIAQAFFERYRKRVHNFYGSSETGGICYDRTGDASITGRSVGKPLNGVSITLKGGRVTVASPAVATRTGRWRLPDAAELSSRGELVLLGRLGRGANIGGKKVHPLEIERALRSLPAVSDAAVWLTQENGRDILAAGVETRLSRAELERALAAQLPPWKFPKLHWIAPDLPRTARGKLDYAALKRHFQASSTVPSP